MSAFASVDSVQIDSPSHQKFYVSQTKLLNDVIQKLSDLGARINKIVVKIFVSTTFKKLPPARIKYFLREGKETMHREQSITARHAIIDNITPDEDSIDLKVLSKKEKEEFIEEILEGFEEDLNLLIKSISENELIIQIELKVSIFFQKTILGKKVIDIIEKSTKFIEQINLLVKKRNEELAREKRIKWDKERQQKIEEELREEELTEKYLDCLRALRISG